MRYWIWYYSLGEREVAMIAVTRVPTHRNDGSKVTARELQGILRQIRNKFGGYSLEGPFRGAWTATDGDVYEEESYKLEVVVSRKRQKQVRQLFVSIGKQLGQRAIYFEVREGGDIIELNGED
jgi:hypothetical protein